SDRYRIFPKQCRKAIGFSKNFPERYPENSEPRACAGLGGDCVNPLVDFTKRESKPAGAALET
ncbi:MAG: hypothetical protein QOJ05_426, partial [Verrucomicrobiota bacterium]